MRRKYSIIVCRMKRKNSIIDYGKNKKNVLYDRLWKQRKEYYVYTYAHVCVSVHTCRCNYKVTKMQCTNIINECMYIHVYLKRMRDMPFCPLHVEHDLFICVAHLCSLFKCVAYLYVYMCRCNSGKECATCPFARCTWNITY